MTILHGKCEALLPTIPDESVHAIIADGPYGISLMNQKWDYKVPSVEVWRECLRVLKPGGHLLSFSSTRTYHRMAVNVEDGGFEIRTMIGWMFGSGKPASHNLKAEGEGWGTGLKPAFEPICVARKPFRGTVQANFEKHGTGAYNIEACRVHAQDAQGFERASRRLQPGHVVDATGQWHSDEQYTTVTPPGRWPANLILDGSEVVVALFPTSAGQHSSISGDEPSAPGRHAYGPMDRVAFEAREDAGSAARFFYAAKPSRAERHMGLSDPGPQFRRGSTKRDVENAAQEGQLDGNTHSTVKPVSLMRYLAQLVTPLGGTILDPYCGSGTTGIAAKMMGFEFIGIEQDLKSVHTARARIAAAPQGLSLVGLESA